MKQRLFRRGALSRERRLQMNGDADSPRGYASPTCLAQGFAPTRFDALAVDPQSAARLARWRKGACAALAG